MNKLSIVIPAYNEEARLAKTLDATFSYLQKHHLTFEIIVVDDGSSDRTAEIARSYEKSGLILVKNPSNMGKGYSVRNGILHAHHDLVLFMDADMATPLIEIDHFLGHINDADILIASRNLTLSSKDVKQPFFRNLAGQVFPFLVRLFVLPGFKDTQCGFKMFHTKQAKRIVRSQRVLGWAFDVETLFIARRMGLRIVELPVRWTDQPGSKLHFIRDSFRMLRDIFLIRFYALLGKYPKR